MNKNNVLKSTLTAFALVGFALIYQNCAKNFEVNKYATTNSQSASPLPGPSPSHPSGAPKITSAPMSLNVSYLNAFQVPIIATGNNITYSWFKNNSLIASANSSTLSFASAQESDSGNYKVVAQNTAGADYANVTVNVTRAANQYPPTIPAAGQLKNVTGQINTQFGHFQSIAIDGTAPPFTTVTFSVAAAGGDTPTFEWFYINSAGLISKIDGATGPTLSFNPVDTSRDGMYRVIVTNSFGSAMSQATLTLYVQDNSGA